MYFLVLVFYFRRQLRMSTVETISTNASGTHQPLTLALGATATALRPLAFRLPFALVAGAPLFTTCIGDRKGMCVCVCVRVCVRPRARGWRPTLEKL